MQQLPIMQSEDKVLQLMQTKWASILNPMLKNGLVDGLQHTSIALINGETTFNHLLGRKLQGWIITDVDAGTSIYRSKPLNDKTLSLTAGASCTVSLWVY